MNLSLCVCSACAEVLIESDNDELIVVGKILQQTDVIKENIQNIIDIYKGNLKINLLDGINKKEIKCLHVCCNLTLLSCFQWMKTKCKRNT
jgi:hypothetical protein